jgi:UDP-3-O-[3-hydroxymyristoyl] glucosamine N-acyltransferase
MTAMALALELGAQLKGDDTVQITGVASLDIATAGDLAFFSDAKHRAAAINCAASVLIVREVDADIASCTRLIHPGPHSAFASALDLLFPSPPHLAEMSPMAQVASSARVDGVRIDAFANIGQRTAIGAGSVISSQTFVGDDVVIGKNCLLHPGVRVLAGVRIGDRCIVHPGAVIGSDGFGFQPTREGWRKVAQVGTVIVGDDVEIGANTTIDRGAIEDTVIGNGVKIDNLVQIAHNVRVGDNTAIAGCVGIAGSSTVGARCMLGGASMVVGHLSICDDVVVSGGTLIATSITQPGQYTGVFPTTEHREWTKIAATLRRSIKTKPK